MDEKIKDALEKAVTGEAKANLRLTVFAEKAEEEGYDEIAKLFRVIAFSEKIHGTRALKQLREINNTEENLKYSFESETKVAGHAYGEFIKLATELNDKTSLLVFTQSRDVEEVHAKLYKEAMTHMLEDTISNYYVCSVCGYVSDDVLPEKCPICGVGKEKFVEFK